VELHGVLAEGNSAAGGPGGALYLVGGVGDEREVTITDLVACPAGTPTLPATSCASSSAGRGGILAVTSAELALLSGVDIDCAAMTRHASSGGAISLDAETATLDDVAVRRCMASGNGGGVHVSAAQAILASGPLLLSENQADGDGGGAYLDAPTIEWAPEPAAVEFNTAEGDGGGLRAVGEFAVFGRDDAIATYEGNQAGGSGGAARLSGFEELAVINATVEGTGSATLDAGEHGGGLSITTSGAVFLDDLVIGGDPSSPLQSTRAGGNGGGLHLESITELVLGHTGVPGEDVEVPAELVPNLLEDGADWATRPNGVLVRGARAGGDGGGYYVANVGTMQAGEDSFDTLRDDFDLPPEIPTTGGCRDDNVLCALVPESTQCTASTSPLGIDNAAAGQGQQFFFTGADGCVSGLVAGMSTSGAPASGDVPPCTSASCGGLYAVRLESGELGLIGSQLSHNVSQAVGGAEPEFAVSSSGFLSLRESRICENDGSGLALEAGIGWISESSIMGNGGRGLQTESQAWLYLAHSLIWSNQGGGVLHGGVGGSQCSHISSVGSLEANCAVATDGGPTACQADNFSLQFEDCSCCEPAICTLPLAGSGPLPDDGAGCDAAADLVQTQLPLACSTSYTACFAQGDQEPDCSSGGAVTNSCGPPALIDGDNQFLTTEAIQECLDNPGGTESFVAP